MPQHLNRSRWHQFHWRSALIEPLHSIQVSSSVTDYLSMCVRGKYPHLERFPVWNVYVPNCFADSHKLVALRMTLRTVNGFESTCVMKAIWSIKAYSFSVPFNWWVCGRAGRCPWALSALAAQGMQHTFMHTHADPRKYAMAGHPS